MPGSMQHSPPRMSWKGGVAEGDFKLRATLSRTREQTWMFRSSLRTRPGSRGTAEYVAGASSAWCSVTEGMFTSWSLLTRPTERKASGAFDFPGMREPQSAGT